MRNILAGIFERAKGYWTAAMIARFLAALLGFVATFIAAAAEPIAIALLVLQVIAYAAFARADYLKVAAEPILARLDFEDSLGWTIPKEFRDEQLADYSKFEHVGQKVRGAETYFNPGNVARGLERLRSNIRESALYSRTLAIDARNVVGLVFIVLGLAFAAALISGIYHFFDPHVGAADAHASTARFVIAALLFLFEVDLAPLAIRYHVFAGAARQARSGLGVAHAVAEDILPTVIEYQLARTAAPLLPTFTFLKKRLPLAAIWATADAADDRDTRNGQ